MPIILRRVSGKSMEPRIKKGRIVVGLCWFFKLKPGDIIIFRHKGIDKIKRVRSISGSSLLVLGDNPEFSTDSRQFGDIPMGSVVAKVIF